MRERIGRYFALFSLAILATGVNPPKNNFESVTVPLSSGTYPIGSDNICLDVSAEDWLKSTRRITMGLDNFRTVFS